MRFWPAELAVGTQEWWVSGAAEAPSRQTGEWRGGAFAVSPPGGV